MLRFVQRDSAFDPSLHPCHRQRIPGSLGIFVPMLSVTPAPDAPRVRGEITPLCQAFDRVRGSQVPHPEGPATPGFLPLFSSTTRFEAAYPQGAPPQLPAVPYSRDAFRKRCTLLGAPSLRVRDRPSSYACSPSQFLGPNSRAMGLTVERRTRQKCL